MADVPIHRYDFAGRQFRIEGLSLWQRKQIRKALKDLFAGKRTNGNGVEELSGEDVYLLLSDRLLWLLAVILLPDDWDHKRKVTEGESGLKQIEEWFESQTLKPAEVGAVLRDFFTSFPVESLIQAELAPFAAMLRTVSTN